MGIRVRRILPALLSLALRAQAPPASPCNNTPAYSPCEMPFELSEPEAAANPNPYVTVDLRIEFRSPRHRTYALPGYWDGGRRMVVRFAPTEPGDWDYHVTSNIAAWNDRTGTFTAAPSDAAGFIRTANMHHWAYTERNAAGLDVPHLWMGASEPRFAFLDDAAFRAVADARAAQKFTHLGGFVTGEGADAAYRSPDAPDPASFERLDNRVRYLNQKGIVADLVLAPGPETLARMFPTAGQRRRFVRYLVGRYGAMNVTWQAARSFEDYRGARALLKEIGSALKTIDPYQHPRSSGAAVTSAPLLDDGWMDFAAYGAGSGDSVAAIEHQLYPVPFVNQAIDSGPGGAEALRHRLWNASMDGQYVACAGPLDPAAAKQMTVWFDFMAGTRHWELEPYFDVDGGRAVALEGAEYVVYVEKPAGPVELSVEKHGYDVYWVNPMGGESVKGKKYSGEHFTGEPPDRSHDWVLHVVREGRIESMNRSYKFESRELPLALQEIETSPAKVPFDVGQPAGDLSVSKASPYAVKITRPTRATRSMMWMWTGDVPAEGQGYRVLAASEKGTLQPPGVLADRYPAVMLLRVYGMNANGKVYTLDRAYQLAR
jgi:hypothetical protein